MLPLDFAPGDEMFGGLPERGIETHSLGMDRGVPDPRAIARLRSRVDAFAPDVVHAHMVHAILLARVTRLTKRMPVLISTMHNQHQGSRWRYGAYRVTDRLTDLTTTVSQLAMEDAVRLGAVPAGRVEVVPNGIDVAGFGRSDTSRDLTRAALGVGDDFVWLAAGRLTEAKDYPNMLEAIARAPDTPRFRLLIAGIGPLEADIEAQVRTLGLEDACHAAWTSNGHARPHVGSRRVRDVVRLGGTAHGLARGRCQRAAGGGHRCGRKPRRHRRRRDRPHRAARRPERSSSGHASRPWACPTSSEVPWERPVGSTS